MVTAQESDDHTRAIYYIVHIICFGSASFQMWKSGAFIKNWLKPWFTLEFNWNRVIEWDPSQPHLLQAESDLGFWWQLVTTGQICIHSRQSASNSASTLQEIWGEYFPDGFFRHMSLTKEERNTFTKSKEQLIFKNFWWTNAGVCSNSTGCFQNMFGM